MQGNALPDSFWQKFGTEYWEKSEFCEENILPELPISEEELFKLVVTMSSYQQAMDQNDSPNMFGKYDETVKTHFSDMMVRIYIEGEQEETDQHKLFPKLSDASFQGYSKRLEKELDGKSFSFVIDLLVPSAELQAWTQEFLGAMYRPLGKMSMGHFWSIFYGNYSTTPYGVHDHRNETMGESAVYFPISGKKEMITWSSKYVEDNPELMHSHDYVKHIDASTKLSCGPKGMFYWPSDRWHIGSSGECDVSIVLAVKAFSDVYVNFCEFTLAGLFDQYISLKFTRGLGSLFTKCKYVSYLWLVERFDFARAKQVIELPVNPDDLQGCAESIPTELRTVVSKFGYLFGDNLEKVLTVYWLVHLTNLGLVYFKPLLPDIKLDSGLKLIRNPGSVILWRQVDSDVIIMATGIYTHEISTSDLPLVEFVTSVESGAELAYMDLIELQQKINSNSSNQALPKLISFLTRTGAFKNALQISS